MEINGNIVRIVGQAENAAQLLQTLGANPGLRDVRAPSGLVRAPAGSKEGFTIEFRVAPEARQQ
jgi:general secretion pathway protein L